MSVHPELEQNYNLILPTTTISSSVAPLCETSQSQAAPNLAQLRDGAEHADSMEVISVINLAALLYVEFGNFGTSYFAVISDYGCLFLPKSKEKERQMFLNLQCNKINTKFWRQDPNRKSHDHVLFMIPETLAENLLVQKPGRGQDVFKIIQKEESFFVNAGLLGQVMALYQRIHQNKHLITDIQVLKKMSELSKKKFKDLETIQGLVTFHRSKIIDNARGEISTLQQCVTVQRNVQVSCVNCNRMFRSYCDLLLHTKTKPCKLPGNLTDIIRAYKKGMSPGPHDNTASCDTCHRKFINKSFLQLHQEIHIEIGYIFPCSRCGRVFLSSYYFLQHGCFRYVLPKRTFLNKIEKISTNNIYGKIESGIVKAALTCPVCEKKCEYVSQLFSHLHLGSPCLFSLLHRVRLDHQISFDFQGLVQQAAQFSPSLIGCEVCDETCVGEVAYIMHMDHHKLNGLLDCEGCYRYSDHLDVLKFEVNDIFRSTGSHFSSLCAFYSHSCHDTHSKFCIFCQQLEQAEPLNFSVDTETLARSVVELLNNFAEYIPTKEDLTDIIEDDDLGLNTINLSFMDYFDKPSEVLDVIELN